MSVSSAAAVMQTDEDVEDDTRQADQPKNTARAYMPKQREFKDFCRKHEFSDGHLVSEHKLLMFLRDEVLNRPAKKSRFSRNRTTEDGSTVVPPTLSYNSVEIYVSAITSLWSWQRSLGNNQYDAPRGPLVKALLKDWQRRQANVKRRRTRYVDSGAFTIQDGNDAEAFEQVVRSCWRDSDSAGGLRAKSPSVLAGLRTACDLLLAHNMLLRSDTRRGAQLPDLFTIELKNEGPSRCPALIMIIDQGKRQSGKIQYGSVVRNKDVRICTIAHLATYLVYRWDIAGEAPPSFQRREQWYDKHLLAGASEQSDLLSYDTQVKWTNTAFGATDSASLKTAHIRRIHGVKQAELEDVEEAQVRRPGEWNSDTLTNHYLSCLPRGFVRSVAGFDRNRIGDYLLPRAKVQPAQALLHGLWPWLDDWQQWFSAGFSQPGGEGTEQQLRESYENIELDEKGSDRRDLAAQGFLALLAELRIAFLQDSVLLRKEYPEHALWNHKIFARQDYLAFAHEVQLAIAGEEEEPYMKRIRDVVPEIAMAIDDMRRELQGLREDSLSGQQAILRKLDELDFCRGAQRVTTGVRSDQSGAVAVTPVAVQTGGIDSTQWAAAEQPPIYKMNRTIQTVPTLWREWKEGLGSSPAVEELENTYGSRWRPVQTERTFFSRRKIIIDEVKRLAASGVGQQEADAVKVLEQMRQERKLSLNSLGTVLEQQRKLRAA